MKTKIEKISTGLIILLCLLSNFAFCQFNVQTNGPSRWAQFNPAPGQNPYALGVGNFPGGVGGISPAAALHVNTNGLGNTFYGPSEVFRTTGPSTNLNTWRLFTGAGNGTEKGMIFNYGNNPIVADQTNFSLQASVSDMSFYTLPRNYH